MKSALLTPPPAFASPFASAGAGSRRSSLHNSLEQMSSLSYVAPELSEGVAYDVFGSREAAGVSLLPDSTPNGTALVPFNPPSRPPPVPPAEPPTAPIIPLGPNHRPFTIHTSPAWPSDTVEFAPVMASYAQLSPPSPSSSAIDPGRRPSSAGAVVSVPSEEEDELERVIALSKLTALSETVSRSWSEGAEETGRVELELTDREREQLHRTQREEEDLRKAMEESLKVTTSPSREHWVELDFWDAADAPRSQTTVVPRSNPASPRARTSSRPLPPPPPPPPPPPLAPRFFQASLPSPFDAPMHASHSYPDRLRTSSFTPVFASPATSPTLEQAGPTRHPTYARTNSLPLPPSNAPLRSGTTRRQGSNPPHSLHVANPSDDTPLPDLVEASYASKGVAEMLHSSSLPTIRGDQWEGASVEGGRTPPPPLTPADQGIEWAAIAEADDETETDGEVDVEEAKDEFNLEPDAQEIELQRARREAMARESFVIDEDEEPSPPVSSSSTSGTLSSNAHGGFDMAREPSSSSSLGGEEDAVSVTAPVVSPDEASWGGLSWGFTTLSPPLTPSAPPLSVSFLPPSSSLSIIFPPPKGEGAFFIKAPSYGALLSGLFAQAKTSVVGSGSYYLAVQFIKLSTAASAEVGHEFSTILWLEDVGADASPLSPHSPRSSMFHSSSSSSLSSAGLSYTPAPSYIVRTSSHLLHTQLLQPQSDTHSSRYNSPSGQPTPQPHHTATLALPMCTPPTSTIHQLVDHLLSLTIPSQGTKTLSRRLNSLITQFTPAGGGLSASSALARFGTDLFGGTPGEGGPAGLTPSGSGLPGVVMDGVLGGEDWYDDADDRGGANGGTGVRSWLKSKKTIIVHKASVRVGHGSAAAAGRRKSETFEAASFITPFSIPESVDEQPVRRNS